MAMPALVPPPANEPSLDVVVFMLADTMASSIHEGIGDVVRRKKSCSWILGRVRLLKRGWSDDEIREAIAKLAKRHHRTEPLESLGEIRPRRQQPWLEDSKVEGSLAPVWVTRAESLGAIVSHPMTMAELLRRSASRLSWQRNWTIQATSAAEDHGELWYDPSFGFWQRTPERTLMANSKGKTMRVQRYLPVLVKPEDEAELKKRVLSLDTEAAALEAALAEEKRRVAAKVKAIIEERERTIRALATGSEVRQVDCEERWSYDTRTVTTVRKDTGEVVGVPREMTAEELQLRMPEGAPA
jgi:hypothetical protein